MTKDKTLDNARRWCRRQYNARRDYRDGHPSHLAAEILREAEERYNLGTSGHEGWCCDCSGHKGVTYLNTGDPYTPTVAVKTDRYNATFCVSSWEQLALNRNWKPEA